MGRPKRPAPIPHIFTPEDEVFHAEFTRRYAETTLPPEQTFDYYADRAVRRQIIREMRAEGWTYPLLDKLEASSAILRTLPPLPPPRNRNPP